MTHPAFDVVRSQIGACGIWCGSCAVGNGSLRLASAKVREVLESHGIAHWAPSKLDYDALTRGLQTVGEIASCPGCRNEGGRGDCEMRACTTQRGLKDCTSCSETECLHAETWDHMRTGALDAGLFVRQEPGDDAEQIDAWMAMLPNQFPSCLLFLREAEREH